MGKKRESKVFENDKNTLLIKGSTANQKMQDVLMELFLLKKPNAIFFRNRLQKTNVKHDRPFEDHSSVEFLCEKNDCSLLARTTRKDLKISFWVECLITSCWT